MKRSCKNIDITDAGTVLPWVSDCVEQHYKRHDFHRLICGIGGMSEADYQAVVASHDGSAFAVPEERIAKEACKRIAARKLDLSPVSYRFKRDRSSGKVRRIGREGAMQQIMDYIAVYSCEDIWRRRLVPQQASSLPGRGQCYGTKMIQGWLKEDARSARYAKTHDLRYTPKCTYSVKMDIRDCYGSGDKDIFLRLFARDCGNADILWLWDELLTSHRTEDYTGYMIGAPVSQYAMQYMMSYAYRQVTAQHYTSHGEVRQRVSHCLIYMDDVLLLGGNARELQRAAKTLASYLRRDLHLTAKPRWSVLPVRDRPVDMMGFVLHPDGTITIRPRIFVRLRRMALRFARSRRLTISQARRVCSYKGYVYNRRIKTACTRIVKKYRLNRLFKAAARAVSASQRRINHERDSILYRGHGSGGNTVYATT